MNHNTIRKERLTLLSVALYVLVCLLLLPFFKEIIDPDDAYYLTIAERYISGDWKTAVNGMWSPLNSWIGALFIGLTGIKGIMMFKYLNIAFGIICMLAVRALLQKSGLKGRYHFPALAGLVPFFAYATYHELAADWCQCMVLLVYLNLIFSRRYPESYIYPVLCGAAGALAYYAKYYNFHFFWLHFTAANFFWFYSYDDKRLQKKFWTWTAAGVAVLLLCTLPWVLLMHHKYGFYRLNYTGVFDLAWSLDREVLTRHTDALLPPTLPGAVSFLEDPIWHRHELVTPLTSWAFFCRQAAVSLYSVKSFFEVCLVYSPLFAGLLAVCLFRFFKKGYRHRDFERSSMLVLLTMPAGYFLFHFEERFLWPLCILGYILGLKLMDSYVPQTGLLKKASAILFVLTFSIHPVFDLVNNVHRDDEVTRWAEDIRPYIKGSSFITNADQNNMIRFAYLTGSGISVCRVEEVQADKLVKDIRKYGINYYLEFPGSRKLLPCEVTDGLQEITGNKLSYVKIYRLD